MSFSMVKRQFLPRVYGKSEAILYSRLHLGSAKKEGIANTIQKVRSKLDNPILLGYFRAGRVREVGAGVGEFQMGGQSNLSSRRTKLRMRSDA